MVGAVAAANVTTRQEVDTIRDRIFCDAHFTAMVTVFAVEPPIEITTGTAALGATPAGT
jgi:hypothetical protein